jgi:hypothetical protein
MVIKLKEIQNGFLKQTFKTLCDGYKNTKYLITTLLIPCNIYIKCGERLNGRSI